MDAAYSSIADATVVILGMLHVLASPNDSYRYLRNHTYDFLPAHLPAAILPK